jgi:hypothetical protein
MRTIKLLTLGALSLLGACAGPAISDIATDKVKVESLTDDLQGATGQANHGCNLYKRVPVFLSKRTIQTGGWSQRYEYLFACMAPGNANVTVERS